MPVIRSAETEEALVAAARLAAERGATIVLVSVIEVPLALPLGAELPEEEAQADDLLDEARALVESYGVRAMTRLTRARRAGPAMVEEAVRRNAELIVVGAGRAARPRPPVFGKTVDYIFKTEPVPGPAHRREAGGMTSIARDGPSLGRAGRAGDRDPRADRAASGGGIGYLLGSCSSAPARCASGCSRTG